MRDHEQWNKMVVGVLFVLSVLFLFIKAEYGLGVLLLFGLLVLLKIEALTELVFSATDGWRAKFKSLPIKIEENIKENKEQVTSRNFAYFKRNELKILSDLEKRYGNDFIPGPTFLYDGKLNPDFRYTPDASLMTENALYLFEVKYVSKPEYAERIVKNTIEYLKAVYDKLGPTIDNKPLIIKIVLSSHRDIDVKAFNLPKGIELEFNKL